MIIHLKKNISKTLAKEIATRFEAVELITENGIILITPHTVKKVEDKHLEHIDKSWVFDSDIQLSSRKYKKETHEIKIRNFTIGGASRNTLVTIGPCGVESEEQISETAKLIDELGLHTIRAGSFKPRTSPYSFMGMGVEGLKLLAKIRDKYGFPVFTEVRDSSHVDDVIEYADVIQIGAKAMYDHGILRKCGKTKKPVLLKRGFGSTLQEFVQAAEFILSGGNENVILCERGIRTFETKTRFTLDLCGVAYLKENTNLPIILDPSHAMGYAYGVPDLARACMAMDVEGLLIEVHPNPAVAKSDASQQLNHDEFRKLFKTLKPIAKAVGREIV
ncbi:MAG TPA: bifunctional 3-deoxy-7-phosphoheptulonate synthase/chorismate mutase [Bacteroidales bacterium]|mgnify:CR=1 FL=1|nr:bifunctional 3-deoxy-7-phosphoheptulonate synthase/chorismate mutase [Bacteroidales bacterium]HPS16293.1 bifunctional 3-deoxy-7-phosphoheptulonate synthase/chorismate mutase [Bacteroidales bacterium]